MAAGQAFYNVSDFTLAKLKSSAAGQRPRDDFIAYLDGFSPNVRFDYLLITPPKSLFLSSPLHFLSPRACVVIRR